MTVDQCPQSEDAVLGGRLRLRQLRRGHRIGHDAVLLAAACPGHAGERAVDLGAGVGAAGLALAARVEDISVTLVEVDARLAALARENAKLNGLHARVDVANLDVAAPPHDFAAAGLLPDSVMRVLMNPPFNDPARQRASPDSVRRSAHVAQPRMLAAWVRTSARLLRPSGTLTLIWRADALGEVLNVLTRAFGAVTVLPVHSKPQQPAVRVVVRATKGSRAPLRLLPGFALNDDTGGPTAAAEAVLRGGATLPLAQSSLTRLP
ncbi:MAG TPA: methyltransferase [Xanthobacteraceae bacterium]|jgi:tRNA1(Val) A37 N6-methylase TrmN6